MRTLSVITITLIIFISFQNVNAETSPPRGHHSISGVVKLFSVQTDENGNVNLIPNIPPTSDGAPTNLWPNSGSICDSGLLAVISNNVPGRNTMTSIALTALANNSPVQVVYAGGNGCFQNRPNSPRFPQVISIEIISE